MYRDFSERSKGELLQMVSEVENEKLSDFTDWFGDRWYDFQSWIGVLNIKNYISNVNEYHRKVIDKNNTTRSNIENIFTNVNIIDSSYNNAFDALLQAITQFHKCIHILSNIANPNNNGFSTDNITTFDAVWVKLENILTGFINPSYTHDDGLHYGGNQGSAARRWGRGDRDQLRSIVRRYFPELPDERIADLLSEMNSEGCNYMAWVNTIFGQYIGREDLFAKDFGFSMYDENGYPNYDLVMLDFYCVEGEIDGETYGLTKRTSETRWENYLKVKKIKVDIINLDVTVDNYEELSEQGEIVVAISPLRLRNHEGNLVDTRDGGHAMVITGVSTINGKKMYKVSSWGGAYYIDPDDFDENMRIEFQQSRYNS